MIRALLLGITFSLVGAATKPDALVTLHSVAKGECGEVSLDQNFQKVQALAEKFVGMRNGTCESEGYIVVKGSKDMDVPVLGQVRVKLYKKPPSLVDFALKAVQGVHTGGQCCTACVAPEVRYVSVDTAQGRCGERCMNPKKYWLLRMLDRNLTLARGMTCRALGFSSYRSTVRRGVPPAAVVVDLYTMPPPGTVTLYKMLGGLCGEAILNRTAEDPATKLAGLSAGTCAEKGYAERAGSHAMTLPSLGEVDLSIFRKAGELDLVDALRVSLAHALSVKVTLFKINKDTTCTEATIDKQFEVPAVTFAGLQEGSCKDHGFSEVAGNQTLEVPVLGELKVGLYKHDSVLI